MNKDYYICLLDMIIGLSEKEKDDLRKLNVEDVEHYYHMEYLSIEDEIQEVSIVD